MLIEDVQRLEKIDRLYSLRLDQLISLPVLAVVGDQSSGKSSVLEALTGLPFPRDSVLCTRFPTQIVFKRLPQRRVDVSIIPFVEPVRSQADALRNFATSLSQSDQSLQSRELLTILDKASHLMGLTHLAAQRPDDLRSFSNDLLKIEISGPDHDHFSVIDLPGLFRKPTPGQTTKEDMLLVHNMVLSHLRNERSIILAVVPANVDVATQEIIQMAEDADTGRRRTLAVLTKPDLVDRGAEEHVINLVNEASTQSGLGYVVVCNRSQREMDCSLSERHSRESQFFEHGPWNAIPDDRKGIKSLKARLNTLAVEASRRSFEQVRQEITRKLQTTRMRLEQMGTPRQTIDAQRLFLLQVASRYLSLMNNAIDAHYGRDECFHRNSNLRLATVVMEENERFSNQLARYGSHRRLVSKEMGSESDSETELVSTSVEVQDGCELHGDQVESCDLFPELEQLPRVDRPTLTTDGESLRQWIARRYREFRGFEIGSSNPSLITALVYEQTSGWSFYASCYVLRVIRRVHQCIYDLLQHSCPDQVARLRLWNHLQPALNQRYKIALEHTKFLVDTERHGYPLTLNHYFAQNMIKCHKKRVEKALKKMKAWHTNDDSRQPLIRLDDVISTYASNEEQRTEELADVLQSYHKVARKRFVDNVCKQVVDHLLICSDTGPLQTFSAGFVGKLSEDDLCRLVGEDDEVAEQRRRLEAEAEILDQGRLLLE